MKSKQARWCWMNFDWFASSHNKTPDQICELDINSYSKIKLLNICADNNTAKEMYKLMAYGKQIGKEEEKFKSEYCINLLHEEIERLSKLDILKPKIDINKLPKCSFFLQFEFTLATPYISRDDEEFYIHENSVRKDKVFKVPMVSGSSWKGNMRWTAMKIFTDGLPEGINQSSINECFDYRAQMVRLFGYEKDTIAGYLDTVLAESISGDDESPERLKENKKFVKEKFKQFLTEKGNTNTNVEGRRGRLNFYPTFFNQIGLEVINPHDRKTKAGTQPIYIESAPAHAHGIFSLLYIPFDLMGKPVGEVKKEVAKDMELICIALKEMMLTYGFSAKKSSGFGIVKNEFKDGEFSVNGIDLPKKDFSDFSGLEEAISTAIVLLNNGITA